MSNEYRHVELLTGDVRRGRWTTRVFNPDLGRRLAIADRFLKEISKDISNDDFVKDMNEIVQYAGSVGELNK
ncbi:hypothetical protein ASF91_21280 [Rhizobium sp. Leaf155]|jgi:hypothetical protein|nr:hypothetical protein ASF91_21280 [Rhizobium sp. Leaf155]